MRKSDRYNPPWERYTKANYMQIFSFVKSPLIDKQALFFSHFSIFCFSLLHHQVKFRKHSSKTLLAGFSHQMF